MIKEIKSEFLNNFYFKVEIKTKKIANSSE